VPLSYTWCHSSQCPSKHTLHLLQPGQTSIRSLPHIQQPPETPSSHKALVLHHIKGYSQRKEGQIRDDRGMTSREGNMHGPVSWLNMRARCWRRRFTWWKLIPPLNSNICEQDSDSTWGVLCFHTLWCSHSTGWSHPIRHSDIWQHQIIHQSNWCSSWWSSVCIYI